MADDDLHTRLTLLERQSVTRDMLAEREDKLLARFETIMERIADRMAEDEAHRFKVFGHEMADQLRAWSKKIHEERDEILDKREAERKAQMPPPSQQSPIRGWVAANWMWAAGIALLIIALRPDLAAAAFRVLT